MECSEAKLALCGPRPKLFGPLATHFGWGAEEVLFRSLSLDGLAPSKDSEEVAAIFGRRIELRHLSVVRLVSSGLIL